jgi:hypothetical protein
MITYLDTTGTYRRPAWGDDSWSVGRLRDGAGTLAAPVDDYLLNWPGGFWVDVIPGWKAQVVGDDPRGLARKIHDDGTITLADGTTAPAWVALDSQRRQWLVPVILHGRTGAPVLPQRWGPGGKRIPTPLQAKLIEFANVARAEVERQDGESVPDDVLAEWAALFLSASNHLPQEAVLPLGLLDDFLVSRIISSVMGWGTPEQPMA